MKKIRKISSPEEISASAREKILSDLMTYKKTGDHQSATITDWESPVFPEPLDLVAVFSEELKTISGTFLSGFGKDELTGSLNSWLKEEGVQSVFCLDKELKNKLRGLINVTDDMSLFLEMEAAITGCECLVARSGTVVVSAHDSGRRLHAFPSVHIVWATKSQIVPFIADAMNVLKDKYGSELPSQVSFITGPSRTADIEKTLVMGAHGPRKLVVLLDLSA